MKNRLVWLALFLSCILVAGGVFFYLSFEHNKLAILNAGLVADVTPAENPALKTNDIDLAVFYQWTKEDPLFTGPGFNSANLRLAITNMEEAQGVISKTDGLKYQFLPINFWSDVLKTTNDNNSFLTAPSRAKAEELISDYKKALVDYRKSSDALLSAMASTGPTNLDINNTSTIANEVVGINNISSLEVTEGDLLKLKANSDALEKEINNRQLCLESGLDCRRPETVFSQPDPSQLQEANSNQGVLPTNLLLPSLEKGDVVHGPYIVPTACFGWNKDLTAPELFFYVINSADKGITSYEKEVFPIQYTKLATDVYYNKFGLLPDDKQFDYLHIPRVYLIENTYLCLDSTYPARLSSLNAFWKKYHNNEIYEKILRSGTGFPQPVLSILKTGAVAENQFFSSHYPSEQEAETLSQYYAYSFKVIGGYFLDPEYRNAPWLDLLIENRDEFLNRYLFFNRGLGDIDLVLADEAGELSRLKAREIVYGVRDLPFYIYASRSAYGLAYFSFSPSFYRLPNELNFLIREPINNTNDINGRTIDYLTAANFYSLKEIESWATIDERQTLEVKWGKLILGNQKKVPQPR